MLKATLTALVLFMGTSLFAQDTHYAQFVLDKKVQGEMKADLEAELGQLPGVLQARVGGDGRNVLMSSIPGIPVVESEIQTVMVAMELEYKCFRDGVIGEKPIRSLKKNCDLAKRGGNVQD